MKNEFIHNLKKLDYLTVFAALRSDPVLAGLRHLAKILDGEGTKASAKAPLLYSEVLAELYRKSPSLTAYITTLVDEDENFYIKGIGTGATFDDVIGDALQNDLQILSDIAATDCNQIIKRLPNPDACPRFNSHMTDLSAFYTDKLSNLGQSGYGIFAKYGAFIFDHHGLCPVAHPDSVRLSDLCGYKAEREMILQNTAEFLCGRPANNLLLYGDAGTGKSATVKAVFATYKDRGLRLIELKKENLRELPLLLEQLSENPLKFLLFIDDLSFHKNDDSFSSLKAVLEGSVAATGSNCIIYATSNRRHLVKESFADRDGDEIHLGDTMQEMLSLSARFGRTITFQAPDREQYFEIVQHYAKKLGVNIPPEQLATRGEAYAIRSGGRSPRTAKHFVQSLSVAQNSQDSL